MNNTKPTIKFNDSPTCGDEIKALVEYYTGNTLGEFTLSCALEEVKKNNKLLAEYKESLLKGGAQ